MIHHDAIATLYFADTKNQIHKIVLQLKVTLFRICSLILYFASLSIGSQKNYIVFDLKQEKNNWLFGYLLIQCVFNIVIIIIAYYDLHAFLQNIRLGL